jgi:Tfp pilus assembly protein PilV
MKHKRSRGLSILEALITLVVAALGLLSFVVMQSRLRANSDVSKQRSEAVRIAQENMENLRAFGTLAADGTVGNNLAYNTGVVDGAAAKTVLATAVSTATNTTYTLTQSVTASAQAGMKDIRITVAWKDRNNVDQSAVLRSVINGNDPRIAAALSIPPNGSPIKDPLGRDLRVPIPAKDLGDGTSAFKPNASGSLAFIFNNDSGAITSKCTTVSTTLATAQLTLTNLASASCVTVNGLPLSGYVRFSVGNSPDAASPNDATQAVSLRIDMDSTAPAAGSVGTTAQLAAAHWPTAAQAVNTSGYTAPDCGAQQSKTVRFATPVNWSQSNNGTVQTVTSTYITTIVPEATALTAAAVAPHVNLTAADITGLTDMGERFVVYTCVVYPINMGGVQAWNGRSMLVPSGWTIGSTATTFKVCRYSEDYNLNGYVWTTSGSSVTKIDNAEHPYAYLKVSIGLNNQNFLVIKGSKSCPTDGAVEVDGTGGENYTNETTVSHQTG